MIRRIFAVSALVATAAFAVLAAPVAQASSVHWNVSIGLPGFGFAAFGAPGFIAPVPVLVAPPPVFAPAPVFAPVYGSVFVPRPVFVARPVFVPHPGYASRAVVVPHGGVVVASSGWHHRW